MPYTALQAALGEQSAVLTFSMVQRACELGVDERADVDWKSQLPLTAGDPESKRSQCAELAKDIAAMANSGGGLIIYGVREAAAANRSRAEGIEPVGELTDAVLQQIRQVAGNLIYPPIVGLELHNVAPTDAPAGGVLALYVPDSAGAPHLVHPARQQSDYFMAPWRDGPHTRRMVERQLATAYRLRDQASRQKAQELDDLWRSTIRATADVNPALTWVVAVAVPDQQIPRSRGLTLEEADAILDRAMASKLPRSFGPLDLVRPAHTRRGLRRYFRAERRTHRTGINTSAQAEPQARVELHVDGSLAIAFTRGGASPGESPIATRNHVAVTDIEQVGLDLLALLLMSQVQRGFHTTYSARMGVAPENQIFRRSDNRLLGHFLDWDEQHRVVGYQPVDGPILAAGDADTAARSWLDVIKDAVNQAGVELQTDANNLDLSQSP